MIYNLVALLIILLITHSAKNRYALGVMVAVYYGVYILLELDYFGLTYGNVFPGYEKSIVWYLICTAQSMLMITALTILSIRTKQKTPLFYSLWLLVDMVFSSVSAVMQLNETNSFIFVYNIIQNINLPVDIIVVIIGTDNLIRNTSSVTRFINYISLFISRHIAGNDITSNGVVPCLHKN